MDYTALYYKKLCEDLEKRIYSLLESGFGGQVSPSPIQKRPYRPGDSRLDPRNRNKKSNKKAGTLFGGPYDNRNNFSNYVAEKERSGELKLIPQIDLPDTWNPGDDINYKNRRKILSASEKNLGSMGTSGTLGKYSQTYRF